MMRVLVTDIVTGVYPAGAMLPRESDLADQFQVSRGVARECIRALEERGLVRVTHGKGAVVNPESLWNMFDPGVLGAVLDSSRSVEILGHYLEFRRLVEIEAAGLAAERATDEDISNMAAALAEMEKAVARPATNTSEELFHKADLAFHEALLAATHNPLYVGIGKTIHPVALTYRYPLARPRYRKQRALPEHRRIFEPVKAGDPEAARGAMAEHHKTIQRYEREYAASRAAA
jgi:DNA-binding FadR family transcriptional regulator